MSETAFAIDLSQYVETRLFGDRPHVKGRRIPIWVIAHFAGDNKHGIPELMYDFDLSEAQALAALLYYAEHKDMIEAQEATIREEYKHFYEDDSSPNVIKIKD
jgi:uncharacterized protein (DUF433 family)